MKKTYLLLSLTILTFTATLAQVTVTNPANTTPNLAATYGTLASAVTALSGITSISGPVIITLNAGNPQTAPAGGYVIQFTATTTAANTITFQGSNNIITSSGSLTVGNINDAVIKLIGADYITIDGFALQENPANNTTGGASPQNTVTGNNMTEWGIALLHASVTNGTQNNTIQNNTISLDRNYRNTFGVYSNVNHSATSVFGSELITSVTGANFGNKVYSNAISNVGYGIVFVGATNTLYMDNGNDIGGSSAATGNTITNWGATNATLSNFVFTITSSYCIYLNHQINENVSYNTITSALISNTTLPMGGIFKNFQSGTPPVSSTSTITNNTITISSLNATSTMHAISNATTAPASATFSLTISNNSIINCVISGASTSSFTGIINTSAIGAVTITNNVIRGTTSTTATGGFTGIFNSGAVVNTVNINNNQVGNASGGAVAFSVATTGAITGISNSGGVATTTVNLNNNAVEGISAVSSGQLTGIINLGNAGVAVNINNNNLGSATANFINYSAATADVFFGYFNGGGVAATTVSSISNNDIRGIVYAVTASSPHQYVNSFFAGTTQNINNNTFTNLSVNTTGNIFFIARNGNMTATGVENCNNNSIVTAYSKTAAGGLVFFYSSSADAVNGSTMTQTGNNFSNVTLTGGTLLRGWFNVDGASNVSAPTKTITGNTFSNITGGSGVITVMEINYSGNNSTVSSNTISNISGNGQVVGIIYSTSNNQGTHAVSSNAISNLSSTGTGGLVIGLLAGATTIPTLNVNSNSITALSTTGASSGVIGLQITDGAIVNANSNIINNISGSGGTSPVARGILVSAGTTVNVGYNKIHTINQTGINTATAPVVLGISLTGGLNVTAHNNFVANLNAVNTPFADAIRGISVSSITPLSTYNLYYNSIHVNSASALATSGTSGVYHTTNATATTAALNMIDNIIVNTSASAGAGVTAAYRRSSASLTNYAATSDYNLFYAGTPSATNLIFYDGTNSDQTLAAYQTRVSARDSNSISLMPAFTSATDLHLTTANCRIDGRGTPVAGITDDIDLAARNATTPDIGADEFTATTSTALAGSAGSAVCEDRIIAVTGTTYTSNACDLIARVLPSGADPVAGKVNVCVTLDATQQYFNGEPYVQRHFDMEPTTSNQTSTSATITLYFNNAEFVLYNSTNPVWPKLPTSTLGNADPNRANVKVTQFHGAATTSPSSPGNYPGNRELIDPLDADVVWNGNYWAVTFDVIGFSGFYVHTNSWNAPLPVIVNYLTGRKQGSNHLLNWKVTCVSSPHATMTLERSADARNYTGINTITADAARCQQPFDYTDANPLKGMNYYRLKIVDADGKVTYSTTVALLNAVKGFDIISIAPNPVVNNNFKLNVASAQAGKMELVIFDMQGRLVNRQSILVIAGFNSLPVQVNDLSAGTYTIRAAMAGEQSNMIRFVKQ